MSIQTARWAILAFGLTACTHDLHLLKMEESLTSYGAAIRFGMFERAADFQAVRKAPDLKALKEIHVSSYDPVYRKELDDGNRVEQTVEIHYYHEDQGVEKSITDHQSWRYDKEKLQWFLESGLPKFP